MKFTSKDQTGLLLLISIDDSDSKELKKKIYKELSVNGKKVADVFWGKKTANKSILKAVSILKKIQSLPKIP